MFIPLIFRFESRNFFSSAIYKKKQILVSLRSSIRAKFKYKRVCVDNDDKNFTLHNCERALKKKRTDKWWFLKMHLKRERERRKKVHREWSWIDTLKNKQLSVGHGYLKVEAKMDPIIIHNSFEISISPSSAADLPRSRPTNDSSSNCMTGERGEATLLRARHNQNSSPPTLVNHSGHPRLSCLQGANTSSRFTSGVETSIGTNASPPPPVFLSFFFLSFPPGLILLVEKKKKRRRKGTINHQPESQLFPRHRTGKRKK